MSGRPLSFELHTAIFKTGNTDLAYCKRRNFLHSTYFRAFRAWSQMHQKMMSVKMCIIIG